MSKVARHPRHPAVVNMNLKEIAERYTVRFPTSSRTGACSVIRTSTAIVERSSATSAKLSASRR